jgi:hypothetical protein
MKFFNKQENQKPMRNLNKSWRSNINNDPTISDESVFEEEAKRLCLIEVVEKSYETDKKIIYARVKEWFDRESKYWGHHYADYILEDELVDIFSIIECFRRFYKKLTGRDVATDSVIEQITKRCKQRTHLVRYNNDDYDDEDYYGTERYHRPYGGGYDYGYYGNDRRASDHYA